MTRSRTTPRTRFSGTGYPTCSTATPYEDFHDIFENESPFSGLSMLLTSTGRFYMMGDEEDAAAREVVREELARTMSLECLEGPAGERVQPRAC